jgi:Mn2+/Fe2+ NRAMP family transporter
MRLGDAARSIVVGLWRTIKRGLFTLAVLAGVALLGLALALPLWAFSSYQPRAFTVFALVLLASGLAFLIVRRIVRRSRESGGFSPWLRGRVLPALRKILVAAGFVAAAYAVVLFLAGGRLVLGALIAAASVFLGGYLRFARGRRGRQD